MSSRGENSRFDLHWLNLTLRRSRGFPLLKALHGVCSDSSLGLKTYDLAQWLGQATTALVRRSLSVGGVVGAHIMLPGLSSLIVVVPLVVIYLFCNNLVVCTLDVLSNS